MSTNINLHHMRGARSLTGGKSRWIDIIDDTGDVRITLFVGRTEDSARFLRRLVKAAQTQLSMMRSDDTGDQDRLGHPLEECLSK